MFNLCSGSRSFWLWTSDGIGFHCLNISHPPYLDLNLKPSSWASPNRPYMHSASFHLIKKTRCSRQLYTSVPIFYQQICVSLVLHWLYVIVQFMCHKVALGAYRLLYKIISSLHKCVRIKNIDLWPLTSPESKCNNPTQFVSAWWHR